MEGSYLSQPNIEKCLEIALNREDVEYLENSRRLIVWGSDDWIYGGGPGRLCVIGISDNRAGSRGIDVEVCYPYRRDYFRYTFELGAELGIEKYQRCRKNQASLPEVFDKDAATLQLNHYLEMAADRNNPSLGAILRVTIFETKSLN